MNNNDLIAEYVKEKYPEILTTCDFAVFQLKAAVAELGKNIGNGIKEIVDSIDWKQLKQISDEALKQAEQDEKEEEVKRNEVKEWVE